MIGNDSYYQRPEVSNSDLSALEKYFMPSDWIADATAAYRFGNLIDAMITEPEKVNHMNHTVNGIQFTYDEWDKAYTMLQAFRRDEHCTQFLSLASGQNVMSKEVELEYGGFEFSLPMRCKYDLWMQKLKWGADIKSTTATTQKQFEDAVRYFNYDRQRAVYMTISGAPRDMIIGISKSNFKVFKVAISKESDLYISGMEKFRELAFKWWTLFADVNLNMEEPA